MRFPRKRRPEPGRARFRRRGPRGGALVCLLAAVLGPAGGAENRGRPEKFILATGMACLYAQDLSSPLTVLQLHIPGGKSAVPPGKDGLAHLATRLALEIPDMSKAQELMSQATRITMHVQEDYSVIGISCLSENLEAALRAASGIIRKPLFTGIRIGNIKDVMKIQGHAAQDDSVSAGHDAALEALFGGRGRGGAVFGTEESLRSIRKKDLTDFHGRFFTRAGIVFSVCTDLDREIVRELLEAHFDGFPEGEGDRNPFPADPVLPEEKTVRKGRDTRQSYVGQAFVLPPLSPAAYAKGFLLEVLLGKPPGSRLWPLREEERLAYNVNARVTWTRGRGILEAYLETENEKTERALSGLSSVISGLWEDGLGEAELAATKTLARSWFLRSQEGKEGRAAAMGHFEALGLGVENLTGLVDAINAVDLDAMNRFIRDVLDPATALVVVVGPDNGS
jgi:zinc protease